jgi:hypothetical protein
VKKKVTGWKDVWTDEKMMSNDYDTNTKAFPEDVCLQVTLQEG